MELRSGDWQNLIYLLVVLSMLLAGLLSRRELNFTKITKYLAIWSALGLAIVGLYAYRFELSDFKSRILGELNPRAAQIDEEGRLTLRVSSDGHFYFNAKISGEEIVFMVDTGASDVVLGANQAKKLGINLARLKFTKRYETANGVVLAAPIILKNFQIGEMFFDEIPAAISQSEMTSGLAGMSFLRKFSRYEFGQDRLSLVF
jgi:aspartyl protease family protein